MRGGILWRLFLELLKGKAVKAAVESLRVPFALETFYSLLRRLRLRLTFVRPLLSGRESVPAGQERDPLLQTVRHLQALFKAEVCDDPLSEFQLRFDTALMG